MISVRVSNQDMADAEHFLRGESEGQAAGIDGDGIVHHKAGQKLALRVGSRAARQKSDFQGCSRT